MSGRDSFGTVFLDRDGTINVRAVGGYVTDPDQLRLLPGAAAAVRRLNDAGVLVVLVSNQRGVARGAMTATDLAAVQVRLGQLLAADAGARLDAEYLCPHEAGECVCRKPAPGLLVRAAGEHREIELACSVLVGDAESDVAAGSAAGTATVRLAPPGTPSAADAVLADLPAAVDWILSWLEHAGPRAAGAVSRPDGTGR